MPHNVNIFICDQVRREDNGKLLFIGAYTDVMTLAKPQSHGHFDIFIKFSGFPTGSLKTKFRATLNGVKLADLTGGMDIAENGIGYGHISPLEIPLLKPGTIEFVVEKHDGTVLCQESLIVDVHEPTSTGHP